MACWWMLHLTPLSLSRDNFTMSSARTWNPLARGLIYKGLYEQLVDRAKDLAPDSVHYTNTEFIDSSYCTSVCQLGSVKQQLEVSVRPCYIMLRVEFIIIIPVIIERSATSERWYVQNRWVWWNKCSNRVNIVNHWPAMNRAKWEVHWLNWRFSNNTISHYTSSTNVYVCNTKTIVYNKYQSLPRIIQL